MLEIDDGKEFEERADFIGDEDLLNWTVDTEFFNFVQSKILQRGAKLIVGPRGTGKTHQMKYAYNKCLQNKSLPLAIYISFTKYYHLEPLLFKAPNALKIFHTWVLCKILLACDQSCHDLDMNSFNMNPSLNINIDSIRLFVSQAEKGVAESLDDTLIQYITLDQVVRVVDEMISTSNRKRAILLLDDAALSLTPDYMVEFFDLFRSLKTLNIAPKASVYPGTTEYGPRFHVGHDAEQVDAWLDVEDENYSNFMDELIQKRLSVIKTEISQDIIEVLKYASFGVPRTFIGLIRNYIKTTGKTTQERFNKIVADQCDLTKHEYLSLYQKMPQYKSIIQTGYQLFQNIINIFVDENKDLRDEKRTQIGIIKINNFQINRMVKFLIEAGLLYEKTTVHHGSEREYQRFTLHFMFLIQKRVFSISRGFDPKGIVEFIKRKPSKHPIRRTYETILTTEQFSNLKLNLPPCKNCGAERLTEEQKYCHQCGKELVGQSAFEMCMRINIDDLPIPKWQKDRIEEQTNLKTIGDILSIPDPASELRKAKQIGKIRSEQIYLVAKNAANEFLA